MSLSPKKTLANLYKLFSPWQNDRLNQKGYWFMDAQQLNYVYGRQIFNESYLKFHVKRYLRLSDEEKQDMLYDWLLFGAKNSRQKRDEGEGSQSNSTIRNADPAILAPFVGGTTLVTYIEAPVILSPSVFSFVILGPFVLR